MAQLDVEEVGRDLRQKGLADADIQKVKDTIASKLPPWTLNLAVIFLGLAALVLAAGAIALVALDKTAPEALWTALGAAIGGLAGIFMGK